MCINYGVICMCSLDGAGWVAGIRKDLLTADSEEQNEDVLEDTFENLVSQKYFCSNLYQLITLLLA